MLLGSSLSDNVTSSTYYVVVFVMCVSAVLWLAEDEVPISLLHLRIAEGKLKTTTHFGLASGGHLAETQKML